MLGKDKKPEVSDNQLKWYHYLISLMFVFVGVVFTVYAQIDITFICYFLGCVFALAGLVSILTYVIRDVSSGYYRLDLVYGVMAAFAALLFYTKTDIVRQYFPLIIGCILLGNGVIKLQHSIDMKRIDRKMKKVTEMWLVVMIFAILCIAAGFISVYLAPEKERTLFVFVGISLAVAGITDIFTHIAFNRKVREFRKAADDVAEDAEQAQKEALSVEDPAPEENVPKEDISEYVPETQTDPEAPGTEPGQDQPDDAGEQGSEEVRDNADQGS